MTIQSLSSKECRECLNTFPVSDFYRHKGMGDGHLNKCKPCVRARVREHREENIDRIRAYDRSRGSRPNEKSRNWVKLDRRRSRGHNAVKRALESGRLTKEPCCICGTDERVVAHHEDYDKPLGVHWMCQAHHRQHHVRGGLL